MRISKVVLYMKKAQVTAHDVAKLAGVSQTTVSFVLNDVENASISERTRKRVQKAAKELGYVPHAVARYLAQGRSDIIGLILIHPHEQVFADPYIPNVISGIQQVTQANGFRILVERIDGPEQHDIITDMLKGGEVAGVIVHNCRTTSDLLGPLVSEGYPIVMLGGELADPGFYSASIDHLNGVRMMVSHLARLGYQRIGCIAYGPVPEEIHVTMRLNAYRGALTAANLPCVEALIRCGSYDPETGYEAMKAILPHKPTAIFCMNDMMAFGAMAAIHEAGLRIPEDIAIVGYDNIRLARFARPSLTTARAPEVELGQLGGRMLMHLVRGEALAEQQSMLKSELVIRDSCGAKLRGFPSHQDAAPASARGKQRSRRRESSFEPDQG